MGQGHARTAPAGLPRVHHLGIVVADCSAAAREYGTLAGATAMTPFVDSYPRLLVDGRETAFSLRLSFVRVGGLLVELLEPLDDRSPHHAFLQATGGGLHHLGFEVQDLRSHVRDLEEQGRRRIVDASVAPDTSHWIYLGTSTTDGSMIELMTETPQGKAFFARVDAALSTDGARTP